MMYTYKYPHPAVTADVAAFAIARGGLEILLIRRARDPFQGCWALPGGFVDYDEDLEDAARRELAEETGIRCGTLEQFGAFGRPGRDPRERTVTVAYLAALAPGATRARAADDACEVRWFAVTALPQLAFDHAEIIDCALRKLRIALEHGCLPFEFLGEAFSPHELGTVFQIVSGQPVDRAALIERCVASGWIEPADARGRFRARRAGARG